MSRDLSDAVIFITGASSGIGAATALLCAKAGMDVALFARREDKLCELAGQVEAMGRKALVLVGDVTKEESLSRGLERTWETFGRLDVVFANAGYGLCVSVLEMTDQQHRELFEVNYFGTVSALRLALPYVRRTEGGLRHVLVCTSAASEIGLPMYGAYSATKAAQDAIAGALRAELSGEGVRVTSVHPVGTKTEFFTTVGRLSNRTFQQETPNTPAIMAQTAEQVGRAIVRALRRPKPEVWPMWPARLGLAITTAFPRLGAWAMRRHYQKDVDCKPQG